jgi:ABC-2 type transport system permease protein
MGAAAILLFLVWRKGANFGSDSSSVLLITELTILPTLPLPPDSFAGERERHTLETLLASSITEPDVFLGKFVAILAIGCAFAVTSCVVGVLLVGVRFKSAGLESIDVRIIFGGLFLGLLVTSIIVGVGIILSSRAGTVRTANMMYAYSLVGAVFLGSFILRSMPHPWIAMLTDWRANTAPLVQLITISGILAALAVAVLAVGLATFKRRFLISPL